MKDNISWYVSLTKDDSTNVALANKKINQPRTQLKSVPLNSDVWCYFVKEYDSGISQSVSFYSLSIKCNQQSQAYPCFHPFDQKEKQFTPFHFRGSVKWKQRKGVSLERAQETGRWEMVGCKGIHVKHWANFIRVIHHEFAQHTPLAYAHIQLNTSKKNIP